MTSMKKKLTQSGFTLIELLIVVIIVAILAAVGIPLLQGNVQRARLTEADAALGTIRTAMRAELAENAAYPTGALFDAGAGVIAANIGLNAGDLTGRFFEDDDFTWGVNTTGTLFCASVTGDTAAGATAATTAPRGNQVNGLTRSMNHEGHIYPNALCTAGTEIN